MKKVRGLLALIFLCLLFTGGSNIVYASNANENGQSKEVLYYYIEDEQITIGLPYEWNPVYLGMPEESAAIKLLGYGNYQQVESDMKANGGLMMAFNGDSSECLTLQKFSKDSYFKFDINNMKEASQEKITALGESIAKTLGYQISEAKTVNANNNVFLSCHMTFQDKDKGIIDVTVIDKYMYMLNIGLNSTDPINAETMTELKSMEEKLLNSIYTGGDSSSLAEDSKALIAEKEAQLAEKQATAVTEEPNQATAQDTTQATTQTETVKKSLRERILGGNLIFWIFPILLAVILFAGMKLAKRKEWQEEALSLDTSKSLQGFCAAAIVLHHMSQTLARSGNNVEALRLFTGIGVLFVGIFFFFSGYGLLKSFYTKPNYLKGFLRKRLPAILVPFYVCNLIFILVTVADGASFSPVQWAGILTGFFLINSQMWYIVEIFFLYLAFYIIFKLVKNEKAAISLLGIFTIAMIVFASLRTNGMFGGWFQGEWWFNSTLLFFVGVLFARFEVKLLPIIKKIYIFALPGFAACTVVFYNITMYMLNHYRYGMSQAMNYKIFIWQVLMIISFVMMMVLISMKVKFKNPMLSFLGKIALELYLIHNVFITYLRGNIVHVKYDFVYVALVYLFAIMLASLINPMDQRLIAWISGKKKAVSRKLQEMEAGMKQADAGMNHANTAIKQAVTQNHFIDSWRLAAAFLVICIHAPFPGVTGALVIAFGKTAVPFFLVVSGYFCYRDDTVAFLTRIKKQASKMFYLFAGANLFYIVFAFLLNPSVMKRQLTGDSLIAFLLYNENPTASHLWFLGSLLYALLFVLLLTKLKLHKFAMYLAPVGLCAYIILSKTGSQPYYVYRNFLLVSTSYFLIGCFIRRYEDKILQKCKSSYLMIALTVLCITNVLEFLWYKTVRPPFISAELLIYVLVIIMLKYPNIGKGTIFEKLGHKCSLSIYIIHIVFIKLLEAKGLMSNVTVMWIAPFAVFLISIAVAYVYTLLKESVKKPRRVTENAVS